MTATTTTPPPPDGSGDPKPAFERVAAAWLTREVDGGQPLDPSELAAEVSVTPRTAAATLAALRASRQRDPGCARVRMLLVRDRIQAAFVAAELRGDARLDAATLAREAGVSATVARQWLRAFRAARHGDPTLADLRGEPAEHRPATPEQLAGLQAAYAGGGRPALEAQPSADRVLERIEQLYRDHEQARGRRLDPAVVARQVGVGRAYAAQTLAALRGGTLSTAERIEQLWRVVERDGGRHLAAADVARMLGVREGRVRQVLGPLRTRQRQQEQAAAAPARRLPLADPTGGPWLDRAACRDLPPGRFFPETGEHTKAAEAKQVCASCPVQGPCRDLAVTAAGSLDADHGVFGGTLPTERSPLRGRAFPKPSAYRQRRDLATEAHELASRIGLRQAARQLGVHRDALAAAWTRWGLPQPQARAGWQPSPFLADRTQAERAYRLAERLGSVNAAAAELGTTWPTLHKAFTRHGLGMPTPDPAVVSARKAAAASRYHQVATPALDGAFVALNRPLVAPLAARARPGELAARVRRAEQEATLGHRVNTRLTAENHWPSPTARAWAVRQRAHHAQQRAHEREASRSTPERSAGPPRRGRDDDQEGDRAGERARERGIAER